MKTIFCKTTDKGIQTFYLSVDGVTYFLFNQNYRVSVKEFFGQGVSFEKAIGAKSSISTSVRKTAKKFIPYISYLEKEMDLVVFDKKNDRKDYRRKNGQYKRENIDKYQYELVGA